VTALVASIPGLDRHGFEWVVSHRVSILNPLFIFFTYIGTGGTLWVALASIIGWRSRRLLLPIALLSAAVVWGADALASLLKIVIDRPRPFVSLHDVHVLISRPSSGSLPSAHATTAFAGAVLLSWFWPRWRLAFAVLALAIAFSRVYVGVHYPTDVLAGAALGGSVALVGIAIVTRTRFATTPRANRGVGNA